MAKSARLDPELEQRVERAAKVLGISQSDLIREALTRRCEEVLGGGTLADRAAPVVGRVHSEGGRARRTGDAFRKALRERQDDKERGGSKRKQRVSKSKQRVK